MTMNRAVTRFVIGTQSAISIVDNQYFKELIHTLNPNAPLMCSTSCNKSIQNYAIQVEQKVLFRII